VSVTDRCDLRCRYCMPAEGQRFAPREALLTYEEIERLVRLLAGCGVRSVRLTGGEPLVRRGLPGLVARLAPLPGIEEVTLTTNGRLLSRHARALKDAGLSRVNVSLDSLDPDTSRALSGVDCLADVLAGLEAAREAGLAAVKVNTVVVRGANEREVAAIVRFCRARGFVPRFIELMPMGEVGQRRRERLVTATEVRARLAADGLELVEEPARSAAGRGPARYLRVRDGAGSPWTSVGFIAPLSERFCSGCNRLRLTSTGEIRPCLGWEDGASLRDLLRGGATDEDLLAAVAAALALKHDGHGFSTDRPRSPAAMSALGG